MIDDKVTNENPNAGLIIKSTSDFKSNLKFKFNRKYTKHS
jgi:hypothetical protein